MILTEDNKGATCQETFSGFNRKQLKTFGISDFEKGWKKSLVGKEVTEEQYRSFIDLRNRHFRTRAINEDRLKYNELLDCLKMTRNTLEKIYSWDNEDQLRLTAKAGADYIDYCLEKHNLNKI